MRHFTVVVCHVSLLITRALRLLNSTNFLQQGVILIPSIILKEKCNLHLATL
jgi:hypothetical protein